jgi:hypothetical protein
MDTPGHQATTTIPLHARADIQGISMRLLATAGGFFRRGISGGERKRVSVGHELLINPSIILLDEPTSGLDSTTAMNLVSTLCQLAAGGRAVITTIHQPSSRLYQQLDKLLLLSDGHAMYYGECLPRSALFCRGLLDVTAAGPFVQGGQLQSRMPGCCQVPRPSTPCEITLSCVVLPAISGGRVNKSLCCACAWHPETRMPVRQLSVVWV